jgi:hypothetical protein
MDPPPVRNLPNLRESFSTAQSIHSEMQVTLYSTEPAANYILHIIDQWCFPKKALETSQLQSDRNT